MATGVRSAQQPSDRGSKGITVIIDRPRRSTFIVGTVAMALAVSLVVMAFEFHWKYTVNFQSPMVWHFQWPVVIAKRVKTVQATRAQEDQHHGLTSYQEYACQKFGPACRVALAIQRAENPLGKCEIYHYNTDGTLDWGYFQINTVHLKRRGVVLRDLLDCRANIDFAYKLYQEQGDFNAWTTFTSGKYRRYLR